MYGHWEHAEMNRWLVDVFRHNTVSIQGREASLLLQRAMDFVAEYDLGIID